MAETPTAIPLELGQILLKLLLFPRLDSQNREHTDKGDNRERAVEDTEAIAAIAIAFVKALTDFRTLV
jgi:hypothetical protein